MRHFPTFIAILCTFVQAIPDAYHVKVVQSIVDQSCEILSDGYGQRHRLLKNREDIFVSRYSSYIAEHEDSSNEEIVEYFGRNRDLVWAKVVGECTAMRRTISQKPDVDDEVVQIVNTGDPSNRIDVVFMGDGYLESQRDRHFEDMERLVTDMFEGRTFSSYLPLFNIWAVYRASNEEGMGVGGVPKDTAYGLVRQGTQLRGIRPNNPQAARDACSATGTNACDYPSLLANDPFYGGSGGEFTISTVSPTSGTKVLAHEFGHTMARVGEEYDGGGYHGANAADSIDEIEWTDWLTDTTGPLLAEVSVNPVQDYSWYDLAQGPYIVNFTSDGVYPRWQLALSVSGCETQNSFQVSLDGVALPWETSGNLDRQFTIMSFNNRPLSAGAHALEFIQITSPVVNQIRQLCSVNLREYAAEPYYHIDDPTYIGAFPAFRTVGGTPSFKPNNEYCLMRYVESDVLCPICKESIWKQFFMRISVIDDVAVDFVGDSALVSAVMLGFAEFRPVPMNNERYIYSWYQDGEQQQELTGASWTRSRASAAGSWELSVVFETAEVRYDPDNLLHFSHEFDVPN